MSPTNDPHSSSSKKPVVSSSSDTSLNATLGVPMPTPGTPGAPKFKGKRVSDFLDALEQHADSARVSHTLLPGYVLRYCHSKVRMVIGSSLLLSGDDWVAVRVYLDDLYGSNDSIPLNSPDRLRQWCSKHGESGNLTSRKDVDKYYRDFTALSADLAPNKMLANEVHLCFYRGIPASLRSKIKKRIPAANLKTSSPPTTKTLIDLLRTEFDDEDLDAKTTYIGVDLDSESDSSSSESDEDIDKVILTKKKKKPSKKVTFEKTVPAVPIVEPVDLNPVDRLTKQMEDLRLAHAEFLRSVNIAPNPNLTNQQIMREARCFFCDKTTHRLGLKFCPEVEVCIKEGLVAYTPLGRLARPDGSELPRAFGSDGGVAKVLREQHAASSHLKGKAREVSRDLPPHMANYAGLLFDGEEVLTSEVFNASPSSVVPEWRASPSSTLAVTRSQKDKETRFDPIKRPEKRQTEAKPTLKPKETQYKTPIPTLSNLRPANAPVQSTPQAFNLRPPTVQSTPQAFNLRPPAVNTEDAFKNRRVAPSKDKDVEMKEANTKAKSAPSYHFTSDIQEMYDLDKIVREKVNKTLVHLELGELLAISAFLQKSVSNMTKTRREYVSKPVVANVVEVLEEAEWVEEEISSSELTGGYDSDDEEYYQSLPAAESFTNSTFVESRVGLEFDESTESKEDILICYASVVKIHLTPQPLFAMVTGRFRGKFAGLDVVFMIDTGSELNLMSQDFYDKTNLAIDLDGTRWSLKGINGRPVPLGGCVCDAEIKISGRRFDHHVFVSREGTGKQEIILGQPWLQWYSASIQYTRKGSMNMRIWQDGDGDTLEGCSRSPSILIPLCTPGAPRNAATLNLDHCTRIEEVNDIDAGK
jgi:hypothetical protein